MFKKIVWGVSNFVAWASFVLHSCSWHYLEDIVVAPVHGWACLLSCLDMSLCAHGSTAVCPPSYFVFLVEPSFVHLVSRVIVFCGTHEYKKNRIGKHHKTRYSHLLQKKKHNTLYHFFLAFPVKQITRNTFFLYSRLRAKILLALFVVFRARTPQTTWLNTMVPLWMFASPQCLHALCAMC